MGLTLQGKIIPITRKYAYADSEDLLVAEVYFPINKDFIDFKYDFRFTELISIIKFGLKVGFNIELISNGGTDYRGEDRDDVFLGKNVRIK